MAELATKRSPFDYKSDLKPIWCAGCGAYGALSSFYRALAAIDIAPENLVIVSGIGCTSRLPGFVKAYGFHTVHGRALPIATGVKVANPALTVIAVGGDGDGLAIGGGHFPHAARRNVDITYIMLDNSIYGQTKGQSSPTSFSDAVTKSAPYGPVESPLNAMAMALAYDASFVAQGYVGNAPQLSDIIQQAIEHKGFSFVHVLSPCVTYNDSYKYFQNRVSDVPPDHDVRDKVKAFQLALARETLPLGIFFQDDRPTFEEKIEGIRQQAKAKGKTSLEALLGRFA
ncbi:MAG: 2-oxoacid:ferredoxin oxidoreductase subunit beta [Dehalococcoidales bacterium]|nr:2-oxoacid:ferredoxin oxidoreductase subunit beta [Dehalococcoidales bacterium]